MNVEVNGPKIIFTIPILGGINVTETIVNSWIIMAFITLMCIFLTHNLKVKNPSKKQIVAEKLYMMLHNLVSEVMGEKHIKFMPYIGALFTLSILGSLSSLLGMRPLTADLSTTLGWALITFLMVQAMNIKTNGVFGWLKSFTQPVAFLTPLNLISEVANPISIAFRHFGNVASGVVITSLVYGALAALSNAVLSFIPNDFINSIPIFQVGLPAILSIYFDLFTSFLQAYIISMLTMVFVSSAAE
ncbi:MAG: F0F1 ATP synthase subunit A [Ruminococcaceae bacterium]|nr:F0F1 ATP synthase subunit A [Oscillospiraceae bacterium]